MDSYPPGGREDFEKRLKRAEDVCKMNEIFGKKWLATLEDLYCFIVIYYIAVYMIEQTQFVNLIPVGGFVLLARIALYFFAIFSLCLQRGVHRKTVIMFPLVVIVVLMALFSSEKRHIVEMFLILWIGRQYDTKKIIWNACRTQFVILVVVIFLALIGIIPNTASVRYGTTIIRAGLGFTYTSYSTKYFLHILMAYIYIKGSQFSMKHVLLFGGLNYFLYAQTNTVAALYIGTGMVVAAYLLRIIRKPLSEANKGIKAFLLMLFPVCTLLPFIVTICYDPGNPVWIAINSLMSGRLSLTSVALENFSVLPFGQYVGWNVRSMQNATFTESYFYVDSSYVNIALVYGWIVLLAICLMYTLAMRREINEGNWWGALALAFLAVHSMLDPQLIELRYNSLLLVLTPVFVNYGRKSASYRVKENSGDTDACYGNIGLRL